MQGDSEFTGKAANLRSAKPAFGCYLPLRPGGVQDSAGTFVTRRLWRLTQFATLPLAVDSRTDNGKLAKETQW